MVNELIMMKGALENITDAVGHTPIVRLNRVAKDVESEIYVKCEFLNPGGSHKDRLARNLLRRAEEAGLKPGGTIVEATSGNTGASLALYAAVRGYKCVFVMPDKMSQEKISNLRAFGARVVVCPTAVEADDPRSYYLTAQRIAAETPNCFYANQYHNPANPEAHYVSTGPEIWEQTGGELDVFVAGMGTGGTISGAGKFLKEKMPEHQARRRRSGGLALLRFREERSHHQTVFVQGRRHRRRFFPDDDEPENSRRHRPRRRQRVFPHDARSHAPRGSLRRRLRRRGGRGRDQMGTRERQEGPEASWSSCATPGRNTSRKSSTTIGCAKTDSSKSSPVSEPCAISSARVIERKSSPSRRARTVREAIDALKSQNISQLPVVDGPKLRGIVQEVDLLRHLVSGKKTLDSPVGDLAEGDYATVTPDTKIELLQNALSDAKVAMVTEGEELVGIVAKIDLIDFLAKSGSGS